MPRAQRASDAVADRHRQAVANTLSWADLAAAEGDYRGAIAWLDTITAIGDMLPDPYPARRARWLAALETAGPLEVPREHPRPNRLTASGPARAAA